VNLPHNSLVCKNNNFLSIFGDYEVCQIPEIVFNQLQRDTPNTNVFAKIANLLSLFW